MSITREVERSRRIREIILRVLYATCEGAPGILIAMHHIYAGFAGIKVPYPDTEIDSAMLDMIDAGLVVSRDLPAGLASTAKKPEYGYEISRRGRDFVRANFPWDRADEYTGTQS